MIKNFLAYELAIQLHRKVETMAMKHSLKDQLERASQSVALNLAEGSAKPTKADKKRFYAIAFGSIREIQAIFDILQLTDQRTVDLADHIAACIYRLLYSKWP
jgi:four helix bundle protein